MSIRVAYTPRVTNTRRTVGDNIKRIREQQGLSQVALGDLLGIRQTSAWKLDHQKAIPKGENLLRIAKALHCLVEDLLEDVDPDYDAIRNDLIRHPGGVQREEPLAKGAPDNARDVAVGLREQYSELRGGLEPIRDTLNDAYSALLELIDAHPLPAHRKGSNHNSNAG